LSLSEYISVASLILSAIGVILTVSGLAIVYFKIILGIFERLTKLEGKGKTDPAVLERLKALETKTDLFWGVVQANIPKLLRSPHTPVEDALLDKLRDDTINRIELLDLRHLLQCDLDDEINKKDLSLSIAYILAISLIDSKILDGSRRSER